MHSTTINDRHLSSHHTERPGRMESVWVAADVGFFRHLVEQQLEGANGTLWSRVMSRKAFANA